MAAALDREPASRGRRPGTIETSSAVALVASGWSEHTSTSLSSGRARSASARAGTWWKAAATIASATADCTWAATEPRGGTSGWNSSPTRTRALAIDTTTLPASCPPTERAGADGGRQLGFVGETEPRQPRGVGCGLTGTEGQLALDHPEYVDSNARMKLHPSLCRRHDVALEELPDGDDQLVHRRPVVKLAHVKSSSRSHSFSHTRRPMAASSTERDVPDRWVNAWAMHITPHFSVPSTSHQRTTSASTGVPDASA